MLVIQVGLSLKCRSVDYQCNILDLQKRAYRFLFSKMSWIDLRQSKCKVTIFFEDFNDLAW